MFTICRYCKQTPLGPNFLECVMVTVVIELIKNKTQNFKDKNTELGKIPDSLNNILMCNSRIHENTYGV